MRLAFVAPLALPSARIPARRSATNQSVSHVALKLFPGRTILLRYLQKRCDIPSVCTPRATLLTHLELSAGVTVVFQAFFYACSTYFKTERLIDLAGTSNIALLALLSLYVSSSLSVRHILVSLGITLWALRLGIFLVRRIAVWRRDRRFSHLVCEPVRMAQFWCVQCVWVWMTALPAVALSSTAATPFAWSDPVAAVAFLVGLVLETIADAQKEWARNEKGWPEKGLWGLSRHPNYFGEILIWTALYMGAAPSLRGASHIAILSPVLVVFLLLFLSGIPILEKSADNKFGADPEYRRYKSKTSVLIPFPPTLYEGLPIGIKRKLFLDFPMYNSILEKEG